MLWRRAGGAADDDFRRTFKVIANVAALDLGYKKLCGASADVIAQDAHGGERISAAPT